MGKNIQIIIGSTRQNRLGAQVSDWVKQHADQHEELTIEVIDLLEQNLPFFNAGVGPMYAPDTSEAGKAWAETIERGDGFIFVTPEYNRSIPASLKNAIDFLYTPWLTKPAAIVSYGWIDGGASASKHLHDILSWVKMDIAEDQVHLKLHADIMGGNGLTDTEAAFADYIPALMNALKELAGHEATEPEAVAA
ncbi:NAD(P)H-dependent oxidoreductase [Candidatus Saccharibacteria bacterium]|nr:NAD(P)H-dependent oxidoreductase [Candidatus Saccharibacteria bacterium]